VTFRPTSQLRLDATYLFTRLSTREDGGLPPGTSGGDIFNNHIARARANYQFTRELSARVIVDYEAVLPNESLVSLEREKRLGFDLLFTYLVNPWTAIYVGYTDHYENWLVGDLPIGPSCEAALRRPPWDGRCSSRPATSSDADSSTRCRSGPLPGNRFACLRMGLYSYPTSGGCAPDRGDRASPDGVIG